VKLRTLAAVATATTITLTGCGTTSPDTVDYSQVCVDPTTQVRLDDDLCQASDPDAVWYWVPVYYPVPALGRTVSGGSKAKPSGVRIRTGAPNAGVKPVTRAPIQDRRPATKVPAYPQQKAPAPPPAPRPAPRVPSFRRR
jgi:hypothetical protein